MDGVVEMHYKERGEAKSVLLETGDIFYAGIGTEHVAHPQGEARILVIEKVGSVWGKAELYDYINLFINSIFHHTEYYKVTLKAKLMHV